MKPIMHEAVTPDGIGHNWCISKWARELRLSESKIRKMLNGEYPYQQQTMQQIVDDLAERKAVIVNREQKRAKFLCGGRR